MHLTCHILRGALGGRPKAEFEGTRKCRTIAHKNQPALIGATAQVHYASSRTRPPSPSSYGVGGATTRTPLLRALSGSCVGTLGSKPSIKLLGSAALLPLSKNSGVGAATTVAARIDAETSPSSSLLDSSGCSLPESVRKTRPRVVVVGRRPWTSALELIRLTDAGSFSTMLSSVWVLNKRSSSILVALDDDNDDADAPARAADASSSSVRLLERLAAAVTFSLTTRSI